MGLCSSKKIKINKLNNIYGLFNEDSVFHVDKDYLVELANKMKNKEIYLLDKKILKFKNYLENLKNMDIQQYIDKLLDKENKIDKDEFVKMLKMFNDKEIESILMDSKKRIFQKLRKQFEI